ncbi:MAG: pantetheine-phosphate adenylyltransferase [Nitrososphaerota archaeon]|nr:pantetheine-phosphate adenylyltransferase [Nitrososphaerota archaeon]MDG6922708.1 pantetheine-phosphate adenylyltransferase [Nitrososphaerota archaeon]
MKPLVLILVPSSFKYRNAALGGTFDQIHKGHKALLERAFQTSESVVIGLTSDNFVAEEGKKIHHDFDFRKSQLINYLGKHYPGRRFQITKLESRFGAGIFTNGIDAIVVSAETLPAVKSANDKRMQSGLEPMKVEVVSMIPAYDGLKISSTRIRAGEIDTEGNPRK